MTLADPSTGPDGDVVEISTPADNSYVSTLRITAASLARRCELTIDDIEDLRLAVDEACALLLPHAVAGSTLDAHFALGAGRLEVATSVRTTEHAEPDRDGIGWTLLGALANSVDVVAAADRLTISVTKAREATAANG